MVSRIGLFFFQAEDGIRDRCVTGVQRCALPISTAGNTGLGLALVAAQVEHLLLAHLVRNHEHEAVALPRGHEREAEPGVAGGRLDERRARPDRPALLRRLDHREADAVLDRPARGLALEPDEELPPPPIERI